MEIEWLLPLRLLNRLLEAPIHEGIEGLVSFKLDVYVTCLTLAILAYPHVYVPTFSLNFTLTLKHQHDVSILLDAAGVSQIAQLRRSILYRRGSVELA